MARTVSTVRAIAVYGHNLKSGDGGAWWVPEIQWLARGRSYWLWTNRQTGVSGLS